MSRNSKWKLEKTKVKVVFRLQFQATHIPQTGWDKLFISFIPADSGKATAKTTKANVRNGICKWGDPIYETTRLLQDSKSKRYDEKIYKFVVAMGSSRASTLGEATINLADYVDALKPSAITLPLQGCNFGTILHITVQLLTSKTGFREFEQQRELREGGLQSGVDGHAPGKLPYSEEVSSRVKYTKEADELSPLEEEVLLNEEYADSATGFDGSSNASGRLYAEKHETSSTHEIESLKSTISGDLHVLSYCPSPHTMKEDPSDHQNTGPVSSGSDKSIDNELAMACAENSRLKGSLELAESSFFNLKLEVSSLQSLADGLVAETQRFSHQLATEISSTEELAKEVSVMKSECLKFKDDIISLKDLKLSPQISIPETSENQVNHLVQNMQFHFLEGIAVVESKLRELQKKTYVVPRDGDSNLFYLELEALLNFLLDFKLENGERTALKALPSETTDVKEITELGTFKGEQTVSGNGLGLDLCPPESILQHFSMIPPMSEITSPVGAIDGMKSQILELVRELDEAKVEKESLTRKMDQMECYYEALIQDLEENQKRMLGELQHLTNEHSTCLYTLSVSKSEMESLHRDMNQQRLQFLELEALNKELEGRATTSEAALRRARLNYSIAVDKLQKDLQLLSSQLTSMFETNENLLKQALPAQPHSQEDLNLMQNPKDDYVIKLSEFQNQNSGPRKRSVGGDILLEDLKRSLCMQEEHYRKVEKELTEMYSINLNLDIYSRALQQSLREADADIRVMNEKLDELSEELKLSSDSQSQLMIRLQKATDDIHALNEYKASSISQCSEMTLQNQLLEDKLMSISEENCLLAQKLKDCESTLIEYRSYESKYTACLAENAELSLRLKQEGSETEKLTKEMSLLKETLTILKAESNELVSSKENMEENINFVQDKLANLLASYNLKFCVMADFQSFNLETVDVKDAILQLEKFQHSVCERHCELMEENQNLKSERAIADVTLSTFRSEILTMKQKFRRGIEDMVTKLDVPSALLDKLQSEIETVANKLHLRTEIEEKYAQQNKVLLADLAHLEDQLQELTCKSSHLARENSGLDALGEELGRSQPTISKLMHDKQEHALCLQEKTEESIKLSSEISCLKETLKILHDELHEGRAYKDELEEKVRDFTFDLNKDRDKLLNLEQQQFELLHVKELASDLELEKSRLAHLLGQQNVLIEQLKRNNSYQAGFESQLLEMHDYSLAADVKLIYVANHYKALTEELVSSDRSLRELQKRYHDTEAMLNQCLGDEADWREEKHNLLTSLKSLSSDLEVAAAQNKLLSDSNSEIRDQLEECKKKLTMMETRLSSDSVREASEVERLKNMMIDAEEDIINLIVSKEELNILVMVLKNKILEQSASITSLETYKDELMILRSQCNELSHKLSEQVLKTEEFKNLSTHLKELKDKAEDECLVARGKRETEVTPATPQDSLRIAFIKEQYESKIQELKQQLSISKKHGEEMLLKLQDAIDELENRKKSEAVNLKKNEELLLRLSALEAELRSALAEKREKSNAYDRTKAELECALLSLECCKEEKEKLGVSLVGFEEEKSQLAIELNLVKGQLEDLKSSMNPGKKKYGSVTEVEHTLNGLTGNSFPLFLGQDDSMYGIEKENFISTPDDENADSTKPVQLKIIQDAVPTGLHQNPELLVIEELSQSNDEKLDVSDKHSGAQRLKSSMEHLHEELEKMKNENKVFNISHDVDPGFQVLQKEIMQLHKANEELGSMFPFFSEIPGGGNALERVLALEVELAEALKAKNKSNVIFQSSFLKQHSDEEAVLKSFRDINELIKEMLELKERHGALEAELREMHDRYSQLSLEFAEVEGERQKLKMTLKNVRAASTINFLTLNRSNHSS